MNNPESTIHGQTIQATFDRLEGCLDLAKAIIPVARVEQLIEILPAVSLETQRFILSELIKLDMSNSAELGQLRMLDFYLPACAAWLGELEISLDLVLEELQVRRECGQNPTLSEYQARFPRWAGPLADFQWDQINTRRSNSPSGLPELESGYTIDDFRVIRPLGRGAFAQVYLAFQESMNRLVALKVSSRGTDEPRTLSQLDHPNIVRVYDHRKLSQQQIHVLYMQAVLGGTLGSLISATREQPLQQLSGQTLVNHIDQALIAASQQPPERDTDSELSSMDWATVVCWIGYQLAEGLQSAHDKGVFHRDVKPANILLSAEGKPKLVDFNVSHSSRTDKESAVGGTLAYMAPEQLEASAALVASGDPSVDHRADLYSLAVVLWELWNGQRPWSNPGPADNWQTAVKQQLETRSSEPILRRDDQSPAGRWLNRILRQAMRLEKVSRPQTGSEFGRRLRLALYPKLTGRFVPSADSWIDRLRNWPIVLVITVLAFVPNALAGILNFFYNKEVIIKRYPQPLQDDFDTIATWINSIAFSLGMATLIYFCWRTRRSLLRAEDNLPATEEDYDWVWRFGHRAALIGAALWLTFGLIFPNVIQWYQPEFRGSDFSHFFLSLAICGGIAWIYPYYGVSLLAIMVYYPQLLSPTMSDPGFTRRSQWMRRCATFYLASSAVIPLVALGLIITRSDSEVPAFMKLLLVVLTFLAVSFSFKAFQTLSEVIEQYQPILGKDLQKARPAGLS